MLVWIHKSTLKAWLRRLESENKRDGKERKLTVAIRGSKEHAGHATWHDIGSIDELDKIVDHWNYYNSTNSGSPVFYSSAEYPYRERR